MRLSSLGGDISEPAAGAGPLPPQDGDLGELQQLMGGRRCLTDSCEVSKARKQRVRAGNRRVTADTFELVCVHARQGRAGCKVRDSGFRNGQQLSCTADEACGSDSATVHTHPWTSTEVERASQRG